MGRILQFNIEHAGETVERGADDGGLEAGDGDGMGVMHPWC